jgi:hypothetical protein
MNAFERCQAYRKDPICIILTSAIYNTWCTGKTLKFIYENSSNLDELENVLDIAQKLVETHFRLIENANMHFSVLMDLKEKEYLIHNQIHEISELSQRIERVNELSRILLNILVNTKKTYNTIVNEVIGIQIEEKPKRRLSRSCG